MTRKHKRPAEEVHEEQDSPLDLQQLGSLFSSQSIEGPDDLPEMMTQMDDGMQGSILAFVETTSKLADQVLEKGADPRPTAWELAKWANGPFCPRDAKKQLCERMTELLGTEIDLPITLVGGLILTQERIIPIPELHEKFRTATDAGEKVSWPLAPLVTAWQNPVREVQPNDRSKGRVIPSRLGMANGTDNRMNRLLFSPAAHTAPGSDGEQYVMPGFGRNDGYDPSPALPLALYDLGAGPATSRGKGAPLALRVFVESVLSVPMQERERGQPVGLSVSLRDFLAWLYPNRVPSPAEYWPRLMMAVEALDSLDARIPLYDPDTGRNELRRVVAIGGIPTGPGALDESVRIIVDLPSGTGNGPQVSDNLRNWGVRSAPAYRLLINLAFHWYNPGVTIAPVGQGKAKRWLQVNDPDRYPEISDRALTSLAFPSSAVNNRRVLTQRAKEVVKLLEQAGELRTIGKKILPPLKNVEKA